MGDTSAAGLSCQWATRARQGSAPGVGDTSAAGLSPRGGRHERGRAQLPGWVTRARQGSAARVGDTSAPPRPPPQYENQMKVWGKWGARGLAAPPGFSDITGRAGLPRDKLRPPKGWRWDGDWSVQPQRRLLLDAETNVAEVLEEVYENESRRPGGEWGPAAAPDTDAAGAAVPPKERVACPQGWQVTDGWRVEATGAVDEAGWEYGVSGAPGSPPPAWHAAEKTYHTHRRRRWLRTRRRHPGAPSRHQDVATFLRLHAPEGPAGADAWEYAAFAGRRFHLQPQAGDVRRRRCWHRRLLPERPGPGAPIFLLDGSLGAEAPDEAAATAAEASQAPGEGKRPAVQSAPLILCVFTQPSYFQLRCYLFQAMGLAPRGAKASAEPVAHVSFVHVSQRTRPLPATLDPRWDQTLLFDRVLLYGDPEGIRAEPPVVVVEVFDQDGGGAGALLGRSVCRPAVCLDVGRRRAPRLRRYPISGPAGPAGELLAAFELLHDAQQDGTLAQLPAPPWSKGTFSIPAGIRPALRLVALEVLAWGLRGLRGGSPLPVRAPSLVVECGGQALRTPPIADLRANPNFPVNAFLLALHLPVEEDYMPPIKLRVLDTRDFGYRPEVGQASVQSLQQYCCEPATEGHPATLPGPGTALLQPFSIPGDHSVMYRGRVLLELSTSMESPAEREKDTVTAEDITRAERYLSRRKYGLCAVFYSATMLPATSELVQFEVSIGNYGNTADTSCKPAASTTQHSRAVYDGRRCRGWRRRPRPRRWTGTCAPRGSSCCAKSPRPPPAPGPSAPRCCWRPTAGCGGSPPPCRRCGLGDAGRRRAAAAAGEAADELCARQPQASVPDVVLRLLRKERRVACARVKASAVMFSTSGACGGLCGKTQTLFLTAARSEGAAGAVCAQLRVRLWLGLVADSRELPRHLEGTLRVYAETYENQMKVWGKWGARGLAAPPGFSDITGRAGLPRDKLRPPKGWRWDGDWSVQPQRRLLLDAETNVAEVLEEVYENESRRPGGEWGPAAAPDTDAAGAAVPPKERVACPQGWQVTDGWRVEATGAVDEAGWEYGVSGAPGSPPPAWHAAEKTYHTHRRRRWLRTRRRHPGAPSRHQDVATFLRLHAPEGPAGADAWEYAAFAGRRFHLQPQAGDVRRRRCWHRRLLPERPGPGAPIFLLDGSLGAEAPDEAAATAAEASQAPGEGKRPAVQSAPLILCVFTQPSYFQLRCYLFQAMGLAPRGAKASAEPVAHVSFVHVSQRTRPLPATLDPRWDQTLLFDRVLLYGDPEGIRAEPPVVVVEVFDQDGGGAGALLGRSVCRPAVCLDVGRRRAPRLRRYPISGPAGPAGELLAAFELLHDAQQDGTLAQLPAPPWSKGTFSIPAGIRPALRLVALEVLAWGLRGLRGGSPLPVRAPSLVVECGGQALRTPPIADLRANPNFPVNAFLLALHLPVEEDYMPPIKLRVLDTRDFGYRPEVGQASVQSLQQYCCEPATEGHPATLPGPAAPQGWIAQLLARITAEMGAGDKAVEGEEEEEEEGDWWSKFYTATGDTAKSRLGMARDSLTVYSCELEALPEFEGLQDFCQTFPLYRTAGRTEAGEDPVPVGEFKGLFRIYPLPEDPGVPPPPRHFQELPPSQPQECLVRVYIIRAFDLPPRDRNGLCDPYIRISLGTKKVGDRNQYVPNTLQPVFGRLFELTGTIPLEKDLHVSLFDYDLLPPDQEIGSTSIDLENRLLSRFRAHCGLPRLYRTAGPGRWRDQLTPSRALERFARARGLPAPEFSADGSAVAFGGSTFLLTQFERGAPAYQHAGAPRERLALHLLHACHLVPEHLETRTLYNSTQPGLEQGKLQMWVDVFPASLGPPGPPVNITPRKPQRYELRCIIWNTRDVDLQDTSLTGQRMSDIYVKGWLDGQEEHRQKTDVHYRSLRGDGSFNWRFVFSFDYLPAEQLCVLPRKEHFWSLDETVLKVPPKLILQVWDNDKFSADDFLGVLELELTSLPRPAQRPRDCTLALLGTQRPWPRRGARAPRFSLFRQRCARGWWPCAVEEDGKQRLAGKLEMSLELLTAKEAEERPAGKGREEPNMYPTLQPPLRPEWSFLWLQAPLRTLRYAVWQQNRCKISMGLALVLLALLLLTFIYSAPGYFAMKLVNPLRSWHPFSGGVTKAVTTPSTAEP
ncbi:myoferlin-like [Struthio camelus]|uniref:myoferlin-like n=1 Tax=Struthio camelus TaxID=8801 RepID=UPI003603B4F6